MPRTNLSKLLFRLSPLVLLLIAAWASADPPAPEASKSRPLFNGTDLKGWTVDGTKTTDKGAAKRPVWSARDGIIHCDGGGFGFLRCDEKFSDFTLRLEYRLQPRTNSGVGIRTVVYDGKTTTRPSRAGYEIQLNDDGTTEPSTHGTGSIYRHIPPRSLPAKPAGEWNQLVIDCQGPHLRIWLNDELVQDFDQRSVKATKTKPLEGFIALQNHGGEVDFRSIEIERMHLRCRV